MIWLQKNTKETGGELRPSEEQGWADVWGGEQGNCRVLIESFCGQSHRISDIDYLSIELPPRNTDARTASSQHAKLLDPTGAPVWIKEVKATCFNWISE